MALPAQPSCSQLPDMLHAHCLPRPCRRASSASSGASPGGRRRRTAAAAASAACAPDSFDLELLQLAPPCPAPALQVPLPPPDRREPPAHLRHVRSEEGNRGCPQVSKKLGGCSPLPACRLACMPLRVSWRRPELRREPPLRPAGWAWRTASGWTWGAGQVGVACSARASRRQAALSLPHYKHTAAAGSVEMHAGCEGTA